MSSVQASSPLAPAISALSAARWPFSALRPAPVSDTQVRARPSKGVLLIEALVWWGEPREGAKPAA